MGKNHRVIGDFVPGVNAPEDWKELSKAYLSPARTYQVEIIVKRSNEIQTNLTYEVLYDTDLLTNRHNIYMFYVGISNKLVS